MKKLFIYFILFISLFFVMDNIIALSIDNIGEGKSITINTDSAFNKVMLHDNELMNGNGTITMYQKSLLSGEIVYCADGSKAYIGEGYGNQKWIYDRKASNSDALAFIFENGFYDKNNLNMNYMTNNSELNYFITSVAVWHYTTKHTYTDRLFNLENGTYNGIESEGSRKLKSLIETAGNTDNHKNPKLNLNIDNKNMTLSSDGKYYVSSPIKIEGKDLDSKVSFSVIINDGTPIYIITTDINSTSSSGEFNVGSTVYVKIPTNQITGNTNVVVKASAGGTRGSVHIWEYSNPDENIQSIATYTPEVTEVKSELTLTISKTDVNISKQDITNGKEVTGAHLVIKNSDGTIVKEWISENEIKSFVLEPGTYTLEETIAPEGYIKSTEKITFVVGEDGKVTIDGKEVDKVVMKNAPIKIKISKQSINNKTELNGAKLRIVGKDNKTVKDINGELLEWTTNGKVKTIQLAPGTYILEEIEAPKGYELSDKKIEFTVRNDGKLYIDDKEVQDNTIVFKNTPEPKQVETGSYYIYIVATIGIIAVGITSYLIYNKYRK